MKEPIRKITLKDGTVRYRLVVDVGRDDDGKRQQLTRTFGKLKEARAELSRIRNETNEGTYIKPSAETVNDYLDGYLRGATRDGARPRRRTTGTPSGPCVNGSAPANSSPSPNATSTT